MTVEEAEHLYALGQEEEIWDRIIDRFQTYCEGKDFVMVSGARITTRGALGAPGSSVFYAKLAQALNLPMLLVHDMANTLTDTVHAHHGVESDRGARAAAPPSSVSVEHLKSSVAGFKDNAKRMSVRLAGAIVTGLPREQAGYDGASAL